jgi:hypothetical protein
MVQDRPFGRFSVADFEASLRACLWTGLGRTQTRIGIWR